MSSGPDYHQDMMTGRTREWKKHYVILNLLLALTAVAFMGLLLAWGFYGPAIGLESAMILFFVGVTALGSVAFIIGRAIVNQEYGLRGFRGRKR